ncbi:MAG: hypothetical protein ACKORJ_04830 [Bacteroidota bacterium]
MAKTSTTVKKTETVTATTKKTPATRVKASSNGALTVEQACEVAFSKLNDLNIEHPLQADLQWCLGSFRSDGNPIGLYQMLDRAIAVLEREKVAKTKGVTAKLITDLSKALKA